VALGVHTTCEIARADAVTRASRDEREREGARIDGRLTDNDGCRACPRAAALSAQWLAAMSRGNVGRTAKDGRDNESAEDGSLGAALLGGADERRLEVLVEEEAVLGLADRRASGQRTVTSRRLRRWLLTVSHIGRPSCAFFFHVRSSESVRSRPELHQSRPLASFRPALASLSRCWSRGSESSPDVSGRRMYELAR
jgi:hypothetical protein